MDFVRVAHYIALWLPLLPFEYSEAC